MLKLALIFAALSAVASSGPRVRSITQFTNDDKITINGNTIAEGSAISRLVGCNQTPEGTTAITVCGCHVKVETNLLTECTQHSKNSATVGACDCSQPDCVTDTLTTGWTEKEVWHAASYEVVAC